MLKKLLLIGGCIVAGYTTLKYLQHEEYPVMRTKVELAVAQCHVCGTIDLAVFQYGEIIQCYACNNKEVVYQ